MYETKYLKIHFSVQPDAPDLLQVFINTATPELLQLVIEDGQFHMDDEGIFQSI